jgi:hypothetical protein
MITRIALGEMLQRSGVPCRVVAGTVTARLMMTVAHEEELKRRVKENLAQQMSKAYIYDVLEGIEIESAYDNSTDDLHLRIVGYVLTRKKMIDLLEEAYNMGRRHRADTLSVVPPI